ncbi:MAG: hypothetical protein ACR2L2_17565 [Acidobacteriota bacterium]
MHQEKRGLLKKVGRQDDLKEGAVHFPLAAKVISIEVNDVDNAGRA